MRINIGRRPLLAASTQMQTRVGRVRPDTGLGGVDPDEMRPAPTGYLYMRVALGVVDGIPQWRWRLAAEGPCEVHTRRVETSDGGGVTDVEAWAVLQDYDGPTDGLAEGGRLRVDGVWWSITRVDPTPGGVVMNLGRVDG